MMAGGSHLHADGTSLRSPRTAGKEWREPTEWTRTNISRRFDLSASSTLTGCIEVASLLTTLSFILYLQVIFSQERSRGEPPVWVQPADEGQAAHVLQSSDEV